MRFRKASYKITPKDATKMVSEALDNTMEALKDSGIPFELLRVVEIPKYSGTDLVEYTVEPLIKVSSGKDGGALEKELTELWKKEWSWVDKDTELENKVKFNLKPSISINTDPRQLKPDFKSSRRRRASENVPLEQVIATLWGNFHNVNYDGVFESVPVYCELMTDSGAVMEAPMTLDIGFSLDTESRIQFYYKIFFKDRDNIPEYIRMGTEPIEDIVDIGYANSSSESLVSGNIPHYLADMLDKIASDFVVMDSNSPVTAHRRFGRMGNPKGFDLTDYILPEIEKTFGHAKVNDSRLMWDGTTDITVPKSADYPEIKITVSVDPKSPDTIIFDLKSKLYGNPTLLLTDQEIRDTFRKNFSVLNGAPNHIKYLVPMAVKQFKNTLDREIKERAEMENNVHNLIQNDYDRYKKLKKQFDELSALEVKELKEEVTEDNSTKPSNFIDRIVKWFTGRRIARYKRMGRRFYR